METGSQSYGPTSHQLLTRLLEFSEITDEIDQIYPNLVKRSTVVTKLPPIVKSNDTSLTTATITTNTMTSNSQCIETLSTSSKCNSSLSYTVNQPTLSASSSKSSSPSLLSSIITFDDSDHWKGLDYGKDYLSSVHNPMIKIRVLEKNLHFIKEQHKMTLSCLHNQIEDLCQKNRDLQFKLIMHDLYPDDFDESPIKHLAYESRNVEVIDHINSLENEVKKLRLALGEALKMNASLRNRLMLKSTRSSPHQVKENDATVRPPINQTSKIESFRETWRVIDSAKVESTNSFLPGIK